MTKREPAPAPYSDADQSTCFSPGKKLQCPAAAAKRAKSGGGLAAYHEASAVVKYFNLHPRLMSKAARNLGWDLEGGFCVHPVIFPPRVCALAWITPAGLTACWRRAPDPQGRQSRGGRRCHGSSVSAAGADSPLPNTFQEFISRFARHLGCRNRSVDRPVGLVIDHGGLRSVNRPKPPESKKILRVQRLYRNPGSNSRSERARGTGVALWLGSGSLARTWTSILGS